MHFDNGEQLGATYNHPFYSATHQAWRTAGQLEIGEEVLTLHGRLALAAKEKLSDGPTPVYNLEVKGLHNYLVGSEGIVVHNVCWNEIADFLLKSPAERLTFVEELWKGKYPDFFKRGSFFEFLMREKKFKNWFYTGKSNPPNIQGDDITNFWLIDFYAELPGGGGKMVASMKTTINDQVGDWLKGDNLKHVRDLKARLINENGVFPNCNNCTPSATITDVVEVQLHVFLEKGKATLENKNAWQAAIDAELSGNYVNVILDEIENYIN